MYQPTTLLQNLNNSQIAERRRDATARRENRRAPEHPRPITRPLARLFAH